jgi:DNA-binding LacI/PurR family transcriptional regulator
MIAMNNLLVLGALDAIREKALQVPRDISIIGWDNFDVASHLSMPLTVVDQPAGAMATMAAEHLLRLMSGERTRTTTNTRTAPQFRSLGLIGRPENIRG